MLALDYTFEKMSEYLYQVRLCGEFVCYSHNRSDKEVDEYLHEMGHATREDFLHACWGELT